jgi:hypothetical protein
VTSVSRPRAQLLIVASDGRIAWLVEIQAEPTVHNQADGNIPDRECLTGDVRACQGQMLIELADLLGDLMAALLLGGIWMSRSLPSPSTAQHTPVEWDLWDREHRRHTWSRGISR